MWSHSLNNATDALHPRAMLAHRGDELLAVPGELRLPHARQSGELVEIERHVFCHLTKGGIMKNDIRRQAFLVRQPFAQRPQALEQRLVPSWDRRAGFTAPAMLTGRSPRSTGQLCALSDSTE
jgi:hypothetical protein